MHPAPMVSGSGSGSLPDGQVLALGNIKFSAQGNNIAKPMFMRQIDASGTYNLVEKAGDMAYPRNVAY